jgi:signal transduction histidine kinase
LAWQSFEADLRSNLEILRGALKDEIREARASADDPKSPNGGGDFLRRAAEETLDEFRLNGLYAEIREGPRGETALARLSGAGPGGDPPPLSGEVWQAVARTGETRSITLAGPRRAVIGAFRPEGVAVPVLLFVQGDTTPVEETLASIRRALLEYGAAGLLLAVLGGYWLATRVLDPIDGMIRQAGRMMALAPSAMTARRLDVPNTGDELGRLAATFNLLLERIEESMTRTKGFIADAAHELKTPVSVVRIGSELALSGDRSADEYREALRALSLESTHLSDLVSDLTLLAEGELLEQPAERRLLDLTELVHDVARSLRRVAAERRTSIEIEAPEALEYRGDERLLRRVAVNLLENAVKFSPDGASIVVRLSREGDRIELRVFDEAETLDAPERERVFERFYRSQRSRSEGVPGSGLGLAIVRWAVMLHGGTARAEPRATRGNAFVIELPAA